MEGTEMYVHVQYCFAVLHSFYTVAVSTRCVIEKPLLACCNRNPICKSNYTLSFVVKYIVLLMPLEINV
jgi:hypothetical protein